MSPIEESVLPGIYIDSGERLEVLADTEGRQGCGEDFGQQAGSILEEFYAATTRSVVVVVWLILVIRLVGMMAGSLFVLSLPVNKRFYRARCQREGRACCVPDHARCLFHTVSTMRFAHLRKRGF